MADRIAVNARNRATNPSSGDAYAYALGTLTYLLGDMYQRHGVPDWHREQADEQDGAA